MPKKAFLAFLLSALLASGAFVLPGAGQSQEDVPEQVLKIVSEKDLVEVYCYEAKWRGGEAVATVEALREALAGPLAKLKEYGIEANLDDYLGDAGNLRSKMDEICAAGDLATAKQKIVEFKAAAEKAREQLELGLKVRLKQDLENAAQEKRSEIESRLKEELKAEADQMAKEAEEKLRAESDVEVEALKADLEAKIRAQVQSEMQVRYGGSKEMPSMDELQAMGQQLADTKGEEEKAKLRAEIEAKYQKKAEEERARLEKKFEQKKEEKQKEAEELQNIFQGMKEKVQALIRQKAEEWAGFQSKAEEKKLGILKQVIDFYFDDGKKKIEANSDLVAKAKDQPGGNVVPSIEELLSQLERDRQEIYAIFDGGYTTEKEALVRQKFEEKWKARQKQLETAKIIAQGDVIAEIEAKADWAKLSEQLGQAKKKLAQMASDYQKNTQLCAESPWIDSPKNASQADDCAKCHALKKIKGQFSYADALSQKLDVAIGLIGKFEAYRQSLPPLEEAIKFKDDLQGTLTDLKQYENYHQKTWGAYQTEYDLQKKICQEKIK